MRYRLYVLAAALLWSTAGAAIKLSTLSGWQVAGGRSLIAALVLVLLLPSARRWPTRHVLFGALAYAATVVLFVLATKTTTAANAIFLQSTAPLHILLLAPLVLGESPTRAEWRTAPLFMLGLALFFLDQLTPGQMEGNLLALASGVAFALTIVLLRKHPDVGGAVLVWGNLAAAVVAAPFAIPVTSFSVQDGALLLFLGVFQLALAYVCFVRGLRGTPALEASLIALIEPVLNPVWAFLFTQERPGRWALLGGAVVLAATLAQTLRSARTANA